ncbi:MAG: SagB/ThcOx family dehydrogenase [Candidatus Lokiarchaeota archaeon]|nr:SagB/ThcOx family dehydrogenase [Candidatus Lokiarchaeota archaeon]
MKSEKKYQEKYGDFFQQRSKYKRGKLPRGGLNWSTKPKTYKIYDNPISFIKLPDPKLDKDIKFWNIIIRRASRRNINDKPISIMQLSQLLFGITGITREYSQFAFRTIPSAGGLYPIETYISVNNIENLKQGIYHYNIKEHAIELLKTGNFREKVAAGCLNQNIAAKASVDFLWTAIVERTKWKYKQRGYRYIYLDAGHIGQNFYLVAEALGLGACSIGAIYDDELNELLDLDGVKETVIYVGVVGNI